MAQKLLYCNRLNQITGASEKRKEITHAVNVMLGDRIEDLVSHNSLLRKELGNLLLFYFLSLVYVSVYVCIPKAARKKKRLIALMVSYSKV